MLLVRLLYDLLPGIVNGEGAAIHFMALQSRGAGCGEGQQHDGQAALSNGGVHGISSSARGGPLAGAGEMPVPCLIMRENGDNSRDAKQ